MSGAAPAWISAGAVVAAGLVAFGVLINKVDTVKDDVAYLKVGQVKLSERMDIKMKDRFTGDDHDRFVLEHHEPLHVELQTVRERVVTLEANH